jgi:hypothetical protein
LKVLILLSRFLLLIGLLSLVACAGGREAGASLSLVVDDPSLPVGSVSYDVLCEDGEVLQDQRLTLDDAFPGLWSTFVELPAGHCEVALTAFDAIGIPLCTGDVAFDLVLGEVVEPTVVMNCGEQQSAGPTTVIIEQININICTVVVVGVRNISQGTGSFEDNSTGDLTLEVSTIGQCSDDGLDSDLIAEAIARDPELAEASDGASCEELSCDDGNDCTEDGCVEGLCVASHKADGAACDNGLGSCERGACMALDPIEPSAEMAPEPTDPPTEVAPDPTDPPTEPASDPTDPPTEPASDPTDAPTEPASDPTAPPTEPASDPTDAQAETAVTPTSP